MLRKQYSARLWRFIATGAVWAALLLPGQAQAQNVIYNSPHYEEVPGCRDLIYKAMEGVALQNVIRDVQAAEEIILKPETVFRLTCFDNEQIRNADNSYNDRVLNLSLLDNRASTIVTNFTNSYINNNYPNQIINGLVATNCSAMQGIWSYLTGNGAVRWRLSGTGGPQSLRGDTQYYYDTDDIWNNSIAGARSIDDQSGTVLNAVSDANITALETELRNLTNDIQPDMMDNALANYGGHNVAEGVGNNVLDIFLTLE